MKLHIGMETSSCSVSLNRTRRNWNSDRWNDDLYQIMLLIAPEGIEMFLLYRKSMKTRRSLNRTRRNWNFITKVNVWTIIRLLMHQKELKWSWRYHLSTRFNLLSHQKELKSKRFTRRRWKNCGLLSHQKELKWNKRSDYWNLSCTLNRTRRNWNLRGTIRIAKN